MDTTFNVLFGNWYELIDQARQRWGKLTDEDITQLSGRSAELTGVLRQRYGYGKVQAEIEIKKWLSDTGQQT